MCSEPLFSRGFELRKFLCFWRFLFASHEYFLFSRDLRRSQFRKIKVISSKIPTKKKNTHVMRKEVVKNIAIFLVQFSF